ncbi:hypothetical protein UAW_01927 [Enterococcus haemoperoxidus ATCC BAA-382]|uniref:PTS EIIB type-3 domain-containing protein n=1 Tax=Enterococcus haemoperoxidus ATCC BAA-382 TaxID=1158608 RepID=R2SLQ9_9ENTE|nr:hypothetical protein [Enterococcus haemoperoxidus]EOH96070.1 hypothetical protein UAW_01927 [Enterococcus haemoperoxidus ATCC BAA-382]EOT60258.1 hypothetical protein I583_02893 [Enterococcus haemoperoxidus ATCC BAA-382]OJG53333.1 hypothetical protein RV06_GL000737 [Enterococcus haemoperoxidus]
MSTAIVVYQSTPMLGKNKFPNGNILGMFKQNKLVTTLNRALEKEGSHWLAVLDNSIADIDVIAQKADAIICVPGLQKQFDIKNYPKEKVFYFDSLRYHELNLDKVLKFLESIEQ